METTQVSNDRWMDKQNLVYTCNGILFSLKKETDVYCNVDEHWEHYTKWNKSVTHKKISSVWFLLYKVSRIVKFIMTESRIVVVAMGWWKEGIGSYC